MSSTPEFNEMLAKDEVESENFGGDCKIKDVGLLQSRIDEQGKLICFLKRRTDDQMAANKDLSERFEELALSKEDGDNDIRMLQHHCKMLEERFDDLSENHDEMIKIKDEYKHRCKELTKENKRLEEENKNLFSEKLNLKDAEIKKLTSELEDLKLELHNLSAQHDVILKKLKDSNKSVTEENKRIFQELCQSRLNLEKAEKDLSNFSSNQKSSMSKESEKYTLLLREKEDLVREVMSRGRLIQEKQLSIDSLQARLSNQENDINKLKEDFSQKEHHFSVNKRINLLMKEKSEVIESYNALKFEYKVFKEHSSKLLAKEKELNTLLSCGRNKRKIQRQAVN